MDPALFCGIGDIHKLRTNLSAVGLTQGLHHLTQRHLLLAEVKIVGTKGCVEVSLGKVVEGGLELGERRALSQLQGIEIGPLVPEVTVGRNNGLNMQLLTCNRKIALSDSGKKLVCLCSLGERCDHRGMRLVGRFGVTALRGNVLELIKKPSPVVGDGPWVIQVRLVELLNVRSVRTK